MKKVHGVQRIRSQDPEDFRGHLAGMAAGVKVSVPEVTDFRAEAMLGCLPRVRLFQVSMRSGTVRLPDNDNFVSVEWPLVGELGSLDEGRRVNMNGGLVHYCRRGSGFHFEFQETRIQVLQFMQSICEDVCSLEDGWSIDTLGKVGPHMAAGGERVRRLRDYARVIWNGMVDDAGAFSNELTAKPYEEALAIALMEALHGEEQSPNPVGSREHRMLQRAQDYMRAHLKKPISVLDVARALGVSVRTLQRQFEVSYGEGPASLLRRWRMEAFHQALTDGDAEQTTVADLAADYGFSYSGRLAGRYRHYFGENPSDTLSSAR